jgi:anti-sigma B factor antagonist
MAAAPYFNLSEHQVGERLVIAVEGEIDLATVGTLDAAVTRAIEAGAADLWIDLSDVEFIDSTGLTAIVRAHKALDHGRPRLAVICPHGPALRAFEVSGLQEYVALFPDRSAASAAS